MAYRLGELTLFERRIKGLADRRHFLQQSPAGTSFQPVAADPLATFFFFPIHPVQAAPPVIETRGGWISYTPYTFRNYYVDFRKAGSFEGYLAHFSAKTRSTLRRKVRRFAEACGGSIDFRCMRTPDEIGEFLMLALPLSARTYQARLLNAGLPTSPGFELEARERAARGEVRAYLLLKDARAAAYVFCYCAAGVASYDYVGFDPQLGALSPGSVLQYLILEDMFREAEITIFDFTEGEGEHKALFATDSCLCGKTYVLRATPGNWMAIQLHRTLNVVSTAVGSGLEKLGIKSRLRALLRGRA